MVIEKNVPLSVFTTFRIGGAARFFVRVSSQVELQEAIKYAQKNNIASLILGGGSNMLIDDAGFNGLVIKIELYGLAITREGVSAVFVAGAGELWDTVVARAVSENLWGIENLSGIPGTVGAAPVQNIGAYGSEVKDTFLWAEVFDIDTGTVVRFDLSNCEFVYRSSFFKVHTGRYVILRVAFRLSTKPMPNLHYADLVEVFKNKEPSVAHIREAVLAIRARKFPDLSIEGTAGSFFLNPIVTFELAQALKKEYPDMPQYTTQNGVKVSLAWILDKVLKVRGFSIGGARLFERQPLVVVAIKGASSSDVEALADAVIKKIDATLGILVECEVKIIKNNKK